MGNTSSTYDIYRDSPLRLMGYANEVAEAFRPVVHRYLVYSGYGVAIGYVVSDVVDKAYKIAQRKEKDESARWLNTAADVALWQTLASITIPSVFINRFSFSIQFIMLKGTKLPLKQVKSISVVSSLFTIPLIVKPIDKAVDYFMDTYVRDHLGTPKKTTSV